tara:strand:- start:20 stop:1012 length:993 start_codon:yes stop_codon:yes gene_type:complete
MSKFFKGILAFFDRGKDLFFVFLVFFIFSRLADYHPAFELFSHFEFQYLIASLIFTFVYFLLKRTRYFILALTILIFVSWNVFSISNQGNKNSFNTSTNSLKIIHFNQQIENSDLGHFSTYVKTYEPDIIILQEVNSKTIEFAQSLERLYPYQMVEFREHPFGNALLSKYELNNIEVEQITFKEGPKYIFEPVLLSAEIIYDDQKIKIFSLHAFPPDGGKTSRLRDFQLSYLAEKIAEYDGDNIIAAGDWNVTPYSPTFKKFLDKSNLEIGENGYFYEATWMSYIPSFLGIPIDHILKSESFGVKRYEVSSHGFGSDHKAILAEFVLKSM